MSSATMIVEAVWFLMPAFFATMTPVFVRKINFLDIVISKKLFGKNKTYRGFFFGILASIFVVFLQTFLYKYSFFQTISFVAYNQNNFLVLGFLIGFGALFGDLVKSFFKRQLGIKPGHTFPVFDQTDYVLGVIIFTYWLFDLERIVYMIIVGGIFHFMAVKIAYKLKIR